MPAILKGFIERVLQQHLLAIEASQGKKNRYIL
jgi:putative NADPH-quinone reductase